MPQTSLLSFLTSSTNGSSGFVNTPQLKSAPLRDAQHGPRKHDALEQRIQTPQPRPEPPKGPRLSYPNHKATVVSLTVNVEEGQEEEEEEEEHARNALYVPPTVKDEKAAETEDTTNNKTPSTHHPDTSPPPPPPTPRTSFTIPSTSPPPPPPTFTLPHLPSISITPIQTQHLPALKRLTSLHLPVKYPDSFYTNSAINSHPPPSSSSSSGASTFSRVALYTPPNPNPHHPTPNPPPIPTPIPIGWIRCSPLPPPGAESELYIYLLLLHPQHRHRGIATALLHTVLHQAAAAAAAAALNCVSAHVWECNEEALEWYEKRDFVRGGGEGEEEGEGDADARGFVEGYYRKLRPGGAWVVRRGL